MVLESVLDVGIMVDDHILEGVAKLPFTPIMMWETSILRSFLSD